MVRRAVRAPPKPDHTRCGGHTGYRKEGRNAVARSGCGKRHSVDSLEAVGPDGRPL